MCRLGHIQAAHEFDELTLGGYSGALRGKVFACQRKPNAVMILSWHD
jgi:hypothetical protein